MSEAALTLADNARSLLGAPFRWGGQSPSHGFDCIGLVRHALIASGYKIPVLPPYRSRNVELGPFCALASSAGLRRAEAPVRAGDILVVRPSCAQFHLGIASTHDCVVHAHASLRRVVLSHLPLPWPLIAVWRFDESGESKWQHSS